MSWLLSIPHWELSNRVVKQNTTQHAHALTKVIDTVIRGYTTPPHSYLDNGTPKGVEGNNGMCFEMRPAAGDTHNHSVSADTQIHHTMRNHSVSGHWFHAARSFSEIIPAIATLYTIVQHRSVTH